MRVHQLNFRLNDEERILVREVARALERREGDALCFLVRKAARELGVSPAPTPPAEEPRKAA